jgi:hypothetical protein
VLAASPPFAGPAYPRNIIVRDNTGQKLAFEKRGTYWISANQYLSVSRPRKKGGMLQNEEKRRYADANS